MKYYGKKRKFINNLIIVYENIIIIKYNYNDNNNYNYNNNNNKLFTRI